MSFDAFASLKPASFYLSPESRKIIDDERAKLIASNNERRQRRSSAPDNRIESRDAQGRVVFSAPPVPSPQEILAQRETILAEAKAHVRRLMA